MSETCTLCGKARENVVYGLTGKAVCRDCLWAAGILSENSAQATGAKASFEIMPPRTIVTALDESIIGQPEAKQALAVALWKQQLRAAGAKDVPRSTLLLYGPTGCGKTALVREAAKLVGLPFLSFDATTLSEAGYRGRDAQEMVQDLAARYPNHPRLPYAVIFLDEVDKLAAQGGAHRAAYSRGTQHALLKLIEGTEVQTDVGLLSTEGLFFVFGGAFSGLDKVIQRRAMPTRSIGFGADFVENPNLSATTEDFLAYGMEPELMGRLTRKVPLRALTEGDLRKVLLDSKLSVFQQYQAFFLTENVRLRLSEIKIDQWLSEAATLQTGARGLQTVVEAAMEPLLFRLSERKSKRREVWDV